MIAALLQLLVLFTFCRFSGAVTYPIKTDLIAPNNVTTAFLKCLNASLGSLPFNVSKSQANTITVLPSTLRPIKNAELQALINCVKLTNSSRHFDFMSADYEDECTRISVPIDVLTTHFSYSIYDYGRVSERFKNAKRPKSGQFSYHTMSMPPSGALCIQCGCCDYLDGGGGI